MCVDKLVKDGEESENALFKLEQSLRRRSLRMADTAAYQQSLKTYPLSVLPEDIRYIIHKHQKKPAR